MQGALVLTVDKFIFGVIMPKKEIGVKIKGVEHKTVEIEIDSATVREVACRYIHESMKFQEIINQLRYKIISEQNDGKQNVMLRDNKFCSEISSYGRGSDYIMPIRELTNAERRVFDNLKSLEDALSQLQGCNNGKV